MNRLRLTEIFFSLQGETRSVGMPTVFIRLTGCPLRCHYCDTAYAFQGGNWYEIDTIMQKVHSYGARFVTVTGGEPLAQRPVIHLLTQLCNADYQVSLETSGALDVSVVDPRVIKILDVKTPGSGEVNRNDWNNFNHLLPHDQIKFVICSQEDYQWSKKIIEEFSLQDHCEILFSPSYNEMNAANLADWIVKDRLKVRFQIQLHKYLWGDAPGR
ncbi:MAG: 7-carboxy-7-deazaguanine synthase QueE [Gammaproteobacteria bacterium]|nr:7-carboxy-7-deazaguanine synthase QueE [Gammaproteobacteria bacterium]